MKFLKNIYIGIILLIFIASCDKIKTEADLTNDDIKYLKSLHILDSNESIIKFYSNFRLKNSGSFFTKKRIANYWIDERDNKKNKISFAFFQDVKSIDTIYNAGLTYSSYCLITRYDYSTFKVFADGNTKDVKYFFISMLTEWKRNRKLNH